MNDARRLERALSLALQTEILVTPCQISTQFARHLAATNLLANRSVLLDVLGGHSQGKPAAEESSGMAAVPFALYRLAIARAAWRKFQGSVYLEHPNIFTFHTGMRAEPIGDLVSFEAFDIVANDVAVQPGSDADPYLTRISQGVLDTYAESVLLGGDGEVESAAAAFSGTPANSWLTLKSADPAQWTTTQLPSDVRARAEHAVSEGDVVMIPKKMVPVHGRDQIGWWKVDPRTGETLGIGNQGWGDDTAEYPPVALPVVETIKPVYDYATLIRKTFCYATVAKNLYKVNWKEESRHHEESYSFQDYQAAGCGAALALCIAGVSGSNWTKAASSGLNFGVGFF
jgi:hypothetical protein